MIFVEAEGHDSDQIVLLLLKAINSLKPDTPSIIVFSFNDSSFGSTRLYDASLQCLSMSPPNDVERKEMLLWLLHRYGMSIEHDTLLYMLTETSNYSLNDLSKLLHMSNKERIKSKCSSTIKIQHISPILGKYK